MYSTRRRRPIAIASIVLAGLAVASCGSSDDADPADGSPATVVDGTDTDQNDGDQNDGANAEPIVVSAADGADARSRLPVRGAASAVPESLDAATSSVSADPAATSELCGPYVPTEEEIADSNANLEALAAQFDRFGVTYERSTDDFGFLVIDYDFADVVAQSVADSFWADRFPLEVEPEISQAQLDEVIAQNDVLAEQLDLAGIEYTRSTDEFGWETLEYDFDDPAAQAAVDAGYDILYPPQPPDDETLAQITRENEALVAAFDAAGVAYQAYADDLGWSWIEWDFEDAAANDVAFAVYDELYPVDDLIEPDIAIDCPTDAAVAEPVLDIEEPTPDELAEEAPSVEEPPADEAPPVEDLPVPEPVDPDDPAVSDLVEPLPADDSGFTDEELALRDIEVQAMVDGFTAAGVTFEVVGDSPWWSVVFDLDNDASVGVVTGILAAR